MKSSFLFIAGLASMLFFGCATSARFTVPENSKLFIGNQPAPVVIAADGLVKTRPFFWDVAGSGIPYRLEKDGTTLKEGKLRSQFRVVSIFWPPYAIIYWPMGFRKGMTYDLVNDAPTAPAASSPAGTTTP